MSHLIVSILLFAWGTPAHAGEDWVPRSRHIEAASQGRDCSVYRTLANRARSAFQQHRGSEKRYDGILKTNRSDLVQCAKLRGVKLNGTDRAEEQAAESCPNAYEQWIRTGFRLQSIRQDRESAEESLKLLDSTVDRLCRGGAKRAVLSSN
ncbi:hypothetical protein K2X33_01140 [bacterium]|nr:hypothetical protein [bacterium]